MATTKLPEHEAQRLRSLIQAEGGVSKFARRIGIDRLTVAKAAAGDEVLPGSVALIRAELAGADAPAGAVG